MVSDYKPYEKTLKGNISFVEFVKDTLIPMFFWLFWIL